MVRPDGGDYLVNIFPIILGLSVATVPYYTSVGSVVPLFHCMKLRSARCAAVSGVRSTAGSPMASKYCKQCNHLYCTHSFCTGEYKRLQTSITAVWRCELDWCMLTDSRAQTLTRHTPTGRAETTDKIPHSLKCKYIYTQIRAKFYFQQFNFLGSGFLSMLG